MMSAGSTVNDAGGDAIGMIAEVYLDEQTGSISWAAIIVCGHRCPIPLDEARVVDDTVRVPFTDAQLTSAPHHDLTAAPSGDDGHYPHPDGYCGQRRCVAWKSLLE